MVDFHLEDVLVLKKGHPCGTNAWRVIRVGADLKLECTGCKRVVMMPRVEVRKSIKKVMNKEEFEALRER